MSSVREPRRRSRALYEEDDADDGQSTSPPDSTKRRKRAPVADDDEDEDGDDEDRDDESESESPEPPRRLPNGHKKTNGVAAVNPGEFHPGAIVRVRVHNFVTYEHAEFLPGPNLNMVIGPNGTGKSSLVCAICLGLGYSPKHLGRASTVGEFVKHGHDSATIEVELQKRPHERANHTIRVQINREDNGRRWWLNNRHSTFAAIQELTRNLCIQIDNLCQFLPQDKVAEFAGLSPTRLLEETLRAAAPPEVLKWQAELKRLHGDHQGVKKMVEAFTKDLTDKENRQKGQEADVNRLRERQAILDKVEKLKKAVIVAEYQEKTTIFRQSKAELQRARRQLEEDQTSFAPALEAVNQKKEYYAQIRPVVEERKRAVRDAELVGTQMLRKIEIHDDKLKNVQNQIEAEENNVRPKKIAITKHRTEITNLEGQAKEKPPPFVAAEWNSKLRQKEGARRELEAEGRELEAQRDEIKVKGRAITSEIESLAHEAENLDSQQGQKEAQLKREKPDAARGWEWLKDHKDEFEKEVFGPPMLTCNVTDKRYTDQVQSMLGKVDYFCFICQTRNDHKKLSDQFYGKLGLSVTIRTTMRDLAEFQPNTPRNQLSALGLDAYAIDFLEGPRPVLANLCAEKALHLAGVGLRNISTDQFNEIVARETIPRLAAGKVSYQIARRKEYGPAAISTVSSNIQPARYWTDQPIDQSERAELARRKEEAQATRDALKQEVSGVNEKLIALKTSRETLDEDIDDLKRQKNELQKAATIYASLGDRIGVKKTELQNAERELLAVRKRVSQLSVEEDALCLERARLVLKHKVNLVEIRSAHQALLDAQIRLIEAKSDIKGLEDKNNDIKERLEQGKELIAHLEVETERLKQEARGFYTRIAEMHTDSGFDLPEIKALVDGKTVAEVEGDIATEESRLEYVHAVDPAVLERFEQRAQEILSVTRKKEEQVKKSELLTSQIQELRDKWEPRVDAVITKINDAFAYNFEQINCAGQVDIDKNEDDFDAWSIAVKVKFRQNETLQQLDQHRQSGGERAVSTIFYLMALQSMAQAPFRVVDEINQGMDPRNERMVHERMVEIACREHTSQYFLITPKLLTGLRYDERMRVLCIASGEHMPTEGRKLDFGKLVRIQKAIVAGAA